MTASEMNRWICGTLRASCTAKLVKNLPAWLTSPPPLEKKKLAPWYTCLCIRTDHTQICLHALVINTYSQSGYRQMQHSFPEQDPVSAAAMGLIPVEFDIGSFYKSQDHRSKKGTDDKAVPTDVQSVCN